MRGRKRLEEQIQILKTNKQSLTQTRKDTLGNICSLNIVGIPKIFYSHKKLLLIRNRHFTSFILLCFRHLDEHRLYINMLERCTLGMCVWILDCVFCVLNYILNIRGG